MTEWLDKLKADAAAVGADEVEDTLQPVSGASIVGTLTDDERQSYMIVCAMENDLYETQQALMARHVDRSVDALRESIHEEFGLQGMVRLSASTKFFDNDIEAEDFFRRNTEFETRSGQFWFEVRERLNIWGQSLSIRKGWRIVSTGHKYQR